MRFFFDSWAFSLSGPIPDGADAVVQVEDTEGVEGISNGLKRIRVLKAANEGLHIRPVV